MTTLNVTTGVNLVAIEATATTTPTSAGRSSNAALMWLKVDGAETVTFAFENPDGNTQTITVKTGETVSGEPILFKNVTWTAASSTSAFRIRAHQVARG